MTGGSGRRLDLLALGHVEHDAPLQVDRSSSPSSILDGVALDHRQADVDAVAVEDPGEVLGDDRG